MGIAENLRILRSKYDLTQQDLADIAGVTNKAVSAWETGVKEPRMGAIEKIAARFNLKKSNLIEEGGMEHANLIKYNQELNTKEERDIAADLERMIGELESNEALAFHGEPMDEETKELMKISLENSLRLAKQMAKQKFDPRKNK